MRTSKLCVLIFTLSIQARPETENPLATVNNDETQDLKTIKYAEDIPGLVETHLDLESVQDIGTLADKLKVMTDVASPASEMGKFDDYVIRTDDLVYQKDNCLDFDRSVYLKANVINTDDKNCEENKIPDMTGGEESAAVSSSEAMFEINLMKDNENTAEEVALIDLITDNGQSPIEDVEASRAKDEIKDSRLPILSKVFEVILYALRIVLKRIKVLFN